MNSNTAHWWHGTSVYQIYPRSFKDSNNDGTGDIPGIISKLDYICGLGFETVWISPFFVSPQQDFGYDISDYYNASPEYGETEDIFRLIDEVHCRGMRIVFDMVLNHTSDRHPWFVESRASRDNPKRDWYLWRDGRRGASGRQKPPTNWKSQTGGSGWQYDEKTDQWYWAAFLPFQPDLNYRNPEVRRIIFEMLEYWLGKGVDGFRLDIIGSIFEDEQFRDSPFIMQLLPDENNRGMLFRSNCRTQNLPESIGFARELRKLTDGFDAPQRFMVGETFGSPGAVADFCRDGGLHSAFAFKCTSVPFTAAAFRRLIQEYEACFAEPLIPVWAFSNHDRTRRISALGFDRRRAKLNAAFQITVRGIPFFYYGEEIGMADAVFHHGSAMDPVALKYRKLPAALFNPVNRIINGSLNRDCVRTPMLWNSSVNAGFCPEDCTPWLTVNTAAADGSVEAAEKNRDSILNCIRRFLNLRADSNALGFGSIKLIDKALLPKNVLGYRRIYRPEPAADSEPEELIILLNMSRKPAEAETAAFCSDGGGAASVLASTEAGLDSVRNAKLTGSRIMLSAYEAVIIRRD